MSKNVKLSFYSDVNAGTISWPGTVTFWSLIITMIASSLYAKLIACWLWFHIHHIEMRVVSILSSNFLQQCKYTSFPKYWEINFAVIYSVYYTTHLTFTVCISWVWLPCCPLMTYLQVQLSETRRELQELKASLRVAQKEKEQLLGEKQARHTVRLSFSKKE